jgi:hypothetical protein
MALPSPTHLQGFPCPTPNDSLQSHLGNLHGLWLLSRANLYNRNAAPKHCTPASLEIRLLGMPCVRHIRKPSSPRRRFRLPLANTCNSINTFRPRGFSPPRRLTPVSGSRILQHDTEQGSLCFSAEPPVSQGLSLANRRLAHPHNAVHTPQRIPLASSRTVSPQPLPLLSFAYATGHIDLPSLPSFPDNVETSIRHLPKLCAQREHRFGLPASRAPRIRRPHCDRLPLHADLPKHAEPTPKCWSLPVDFRALLHRRVRTVWTVSSTATAYPSMGFVPLQGAALSDSCRPPHGDRDTRRNRSSSRYTASLFWFRAPAS